MSAASHAYDGRFCELCYSGPCQRESPKMPQVRPYREVCPHPQDMLKELAEGIMCGIEMTITCCLRCGLAFPGQRAEDLRVA